MPTFSSKMPVFVFCTREGPGQAGYESRVKDVCLSLNQKNLKTRILSTAYWHRHLKEKDLSLFKKITLNIKSFFFLYDLKPNNVILNRIHYHSIGPLLYTFISRCSLIVDQDDWEMKENLKIKFNLIPNSLTYCLSQLAFLKARKIIFSSTYLEKQFQLKKRTTCIPTVVNTTLFPITKFEPKLLNSARCIWVGSVDREDTLNEILDLLNHFEKVKSKKIILQLIVRGQYVQRVADHLNHRKIQNVQLTTNLSRKNISKEMREFDVGLLPLFNKSHFNRSKSPVKFYEYLACGLIPLTSNIGQAAELLKENDLGELICNSPEQMISKAENLTKLDKNSQSTLINSLEKIQNKAYINHYQQKWLEALTC